MLKTLKIILVSALTILYSCAAPSTITIGSDFEKDSYTHTEKSNCKIVINSLEDHRNDKQSLGRLSFTEVFSEDALQWVRNGFNNFGIGNENSSLQTNKIIKINVVLKLAHINHLLSTKAANVVLGISQDTKKSIKYFRGSHASVNWNGSHTEIKGAFDLSLSQSIEMITKELNANCKS